MTDAAANPSRLGGTEHDVMAAVPTSDLLAVVFGQVKAVETASDDKVREVVRKAFEQLVKDIEGFLHLHPEIDFLTVQKIIFKTVAILVSTRHCQLPHVCSSCSELVVFREELNSGAVDRGSWAKDLYQDLLDQASLASHPELARKTGLDQLQTPTQGALDLFLTISARYGGISSLCPTKDYSTFLTKIIQQLQRMDHSVVPMSLKRALDSGADCEALYLNLLDLEGVRLSKIFLTGMYGSGKTTILEFILRRLLGAEPATVVYIVVWQRSTDLMARFRASFPQPNVHVMSSKKICQELGVQLDKADKAGTLSNICRRLREQEARTGLPRVLAVDEMEPRANDDIRNPSYDYRALDNSGVDTIICVSPTTVADGSSSPSVQGPPCLHRLDLHRVYRCTQAILHWITYVMDEMEAAGGGYPYPRSFSLTNVQPGHEVVGSLPECLVLPPCSCTSYCSTPLSCLLHPHGLTVMAVMTRLLAEGVKPGDLVILSATLDQYTECKAWLEAEVAARPQMAGLKVKNRQDFRGCEAPVLLWIGGGAVSLLWDSVTRVTSRLLVIVMPDGGRVDKFISAVEKSCREGRARRAVEQGTV